MNSLGVQCMGGPNIDLCVLAEFHLRAPENLKTKSLSFCPGTICSRFARSGAVCADLELGVRRRTLIWKAIPIDTDPVVYVEA